MKLTIAKFLKTKHMNIATDVEFIAFRKMFPTVLKASRNLHTGQDFRFPPGAKRPANLIRWKAIREGIFKFIYIIPTLSEKVCCVGILHQPKQKIHQFVSSLSCFLG